jgi:peptidoglycan/LPS O-acetylase OafA/YrhL
MGLLRLLLALIVLASHSGGLFNYNVANSSVAVFSFFIISGFYMTLILDKKYIDKKASKFFSNRILRIFPTYWLTLTVFIILILLKFFFHIGTSDNAIDHYLKYMPETSPFSYIMNLLNFVSRNITLIFTSDYFLKSNNTGGFLLVQQAWTLQIELLFYLIAPFLVKLSQKLFLIFIAFYIILFFLIIEPLHLIPEYTLTYAFISNLFFFLLGILSYKFIFKKMKKKHLNSRLALSISLAFFAYLLFYNYIPFKLFLPILNISDPFYFLILTLSIPFTFSLSSTNLIDRFMGNLSYPVYITHFLIIKALSNLSVFKSNSDLKTVVIIVISLIISALIFLYVERPIDKYRQQRLKTD